ncbi:MULTISPECIES: hypothetical protein [Listeriaceae]|uniref:Uncharacterized protein n=1 Tax=Listeria newyorkensis TaxID=1497681 RepID=A0A841YY01_9LIST|nr:MULTISPECIES: hypothetical protein [Listeria]MBC1458731.1 hypothetical protein [Listeria newyorkensis]WAO22366.1 hypothetical protein OTR81_03560 [Listeria newyorkensis]SQC50580.1 Uncharacterised protein [Listeria newyorkensis]
MMAFSLGDMIFTAIVFFIPITIIIAIILLVITLSRTKNRPARDKYPDHKA